MDLLGHRRNINDWEWDGGLWCSDNVAMITIRNYRQSYSDLVPQYCLTICDTLKWNFALPIYLLLSLRGAVEGKPLFPFSLLSGGMKALMAVISLSHQIEAMPWYFY